MRSEIKHSVWALVCLFFVGSVWALGADNSLPLPRQTAGTLVTPPIFTDLPLTNSPARSRSAPARPLTAATNPTRPVWHRSMDSLDDAQKLGVGDRVTFRVLEDQEEQKTLTVTDAGELDVPELGLVRARGKTCRQLAGEIKVRLEQTTYYQATVLLGVDKLNPGMSGRRVYVMGEVQRPGPQEIPGGEAWTVSKAIMRTGGFTPYAARNKVRVVRAGPRGTPGKSYIVDINQIWQKGRTDLDMAVEPEDVIVVPPRGVNFFVE